eukprot:7109581-Alexandrium_andersonii.AAC.1
MCELERAGGLWPTLPSPSPPLPVVGAGWCGFPGLGVGGGAEAYVGLLGPARLSCRRGGLPRVPRAPRAVQAAGGA